MSSQRCLPQFEFLLTEVEHRLIVYEEVSYSPIAPARVSPVASKRPSYQFSVPSKELPYWRTSELLGHLRVQTQEQFEESKLRNQQVLGFEAHLRQPFYNAPGPDIPYYQKSERQGSKPFVIPAKFVVRSKGPVQCCARCTFK
ncbi:hypothetical protein L596_024458 [Steinernema carpocapsae]|uniref:Uncharacterized protein n=1 Tax=Steinernema carpocapsae TaxID=34508 RepID=A0A4U5MGT7_STECR|nr:hypothetical protein L596_024458 [Steinernema carpocapsae]